MERNIFKETVTLFATCIPNDWLPGLVMKRATELKGEDEYREFMEAIAAVTSVMNIAAKKDLTHSMAVMLEMYWARERSAEEAERTRKSVEKYISEVPGE